MGGNSQPSVTAGGSDRRDGRITAVNSTAISEIVGTIKWFDLGKGFGFIQPDADFIVPDTGKPDILLHISRLRDGGYRTAFEGARMHCEVEKRTRGMQVRRIISMDESTAVHPSQRQQRTNVTVTASSGWEAATVKWYNRKRGYGFLTRGEGTDDIFIHAETLRCFGFTELKPGQKVQVRYGDSTNGSMAAEIRPDDGKGNPPVSH